MIDNHQIDVEMVAFLSCVHSTCNRCLSVPFEELLTRLEGLSGAWRDSERRVREERVINESLPALSSFERRRTVKWATLRRSLPSRTRLLLSRESYEAFSYGHGLESVSAGLVSSHAGRSSASPVLSDRFIHS